MYWQQLNLCLEKPQVDHTTNLLTQLGALAVTLCDGKSTAIYEPEPGKVEYWPNVSLTALFSQEAELDLVVAVLSNTLTKEVIKTIEIETIVDEDWQRRCLDGFKPICFGERLWVCPSWQTPPDAAAVTIRLDPGLAFGTGTHPTSALCLAWLDSKNLKNQKIIDFGCGSGILAVAAAKLGATKIWAIDHDSQALRATRQNAEINQVLSANFWIGDLQQLQKPVSADILIANILAKPLLSLLPEFLGLLKPSGTIVLSGVLVSQAELILSAYRPYFDICIDKQDEEWLRIVGNRLNCKQ